MKNAEMTPKKRIDQPKIVLHLIAAIAFFGALLEFDMPKPSTQPAYSLSCPIVKAPHTDSMGEYEVLSQRCFWLKI